MLRFRLTVTLPSSWRSDRLGPRDIEQGCVAKAMLVDLFTWHTCLREYLHLAPEECLPRESGDTCDLSPNLCINSHYEWNEQCQAAFDELKMKLTITPTLAHPDYEKPFLLYTDASGIELGAVLAQQDNEGNEHPINYLSRTLTPAESNYTITELECLAIVWSVRKVHAYLDGVKFTLITDHSALQWLFDFKGSNRRLVRWSLELQPYRDWMTIKYREGRIHLNADPLSRAPLPVCNSITTVQIPQEFPTALKEEYTFDLYFQKIQEGITSEPPFREFDRFGITSDNLLTYKDPGDEHLRICVPQEYGEQKPRLDLIHDFHDSDIAGDLGIARATNAIGQQYYWPGLTKDIMITYAHAPSVNVTKPATKPTAYTHRWIYFHPDGIQSQWTSLDRLLLLEKVTGTWYF